MVLKQWFLVVPVFKLMRLCLKSTVIHLKFGHKHQKHFYISVAPKLEGKSKMPHFSLWIENVRPDSKARAPWNTSISCHVYESFRSLLVLFVKAGGWVVHFAPVVHFTQLPPTNFDKNLPEMQRGQCLTGQSASPYHQQLFDSPGQCDWVCISTKALKYGRCPVFSTIPAFLQAPGQWYPL